MPHTKTVPAVVRLYVSALYLSAGTLQATSVYMKVGYSEQTTTVMTIQLPNTGQFLAFQNL